MKRLFALLLAVAMVLSLGVTAFATETTPDGSITITNPTIGETYRLYKFFDATYATYMNENDEEVILTDDEGNAVVSYTIDPENNQFFALMFGADGKGTNNFFEYDEKTGVVKLREHTVKEEIITYLGTLIKNENISPDDTDGLTADDTEDTIVFDDLAPGYYLVDRGVSSTVTITTNMPNVEIIDKNQLPNAQESFNKLVFDEENNAWVESSSAIVGEVVDFKINFEATNYAHDKRVDYYVIRDDKDSALWIEFNDITVTVGEETLGKGYYFCAGDPNLDTGDWTNAQNPEKWAATPAEADWYLIHYTVDIIEIVIPWVTDSTFNPPTSSTTSTEPSYSMTVGEDAESKFDSPVTVTVEYSASVGPDAVGAVNGTVRNAAYLKWYCGDEPDGPDMPQRTETTVYNLGINKIDGSNNEALADAVFELYEDRACTKPVYVIPVNEEKTVFIVDDAMTNISGANRITTREAYDKDLWKDYILGAEDLDFEEGDSEDEILAKNCRNDMTTPADGKLVILGLEANTYFLKETKAPNGYNKLSDPAEVVVGSGTDTDEYNGYSVYYVTVRNNRGAELPSTGGEGRMMLISVGTMIAIGFAVLMITQKKMSVYRD